MSLIYHSSFLSFCILSGSFGLERFLEIRLASSNLEVKFSSSLDSRVKGKFFLRRAKLSEALVEFRDEFQGTLLAFTHDGEISGELDFMYPNRTQWLTRG
jgi:hypothetical protein